MLQDVWLTVLRKIKKLRNPNAFCLWLYKIARNRAYAGFRNHRQFTPIPEEELPAELTNDEPVFSAGQAGQIHKALDNIQSYHREVLTLYFLEKMPYETIAQVVGCSLGTVKSRMYYAKQALRKELENHDG